MGSGASRVLCGRPALPRLLSLALVPSPPRAPGPRPAGLEAPWSSMARPVLLGVLGTPPGLCCSPQHVGHATPPPCHSRGPIQHFLRHSGAPVSLWLIGDAPWSASPRPPFLAAAHGWAALADGHLLPSFRPDRACRGRGGVAQVRRSIRRRLSSSCPRTGLPTDAFPFLPSEPLRLALRRGCSQGARVPGFVVGLSLRAASPALTRLRPPAVSSLLGGRSRLDTHPHS